MARVLAVAVAVFVSILAYVYAFPGTAKTSADSMEGVEKIKGFNPRIAVPTPFEPIIDVPFESASKGSKTVSDSMLVLGVHHNGVAKAYPIWMLCGPTREIVNDTFGDQHLAATW